MPVIELRCTACKAIFFITTIHPQLFETFCLFMLGTDMEILGVHSWLFSQKSHFLELYLQDNYLSCLASLSNFLI